MKTNSELQKDVQDAIKWEPLLHSAEIGVTAKDGVVSLTGVVDSFAKKAGAEKAAIKIKGVKALVENIEVNFPNSWTKSDADVANEVLAALKSNDTVPDEKVSVKVEDGWVTLGGELNWNYERDAAKKAINFLPGIKAITNNIKIKSKVHDEIEKKDIENALRRSVIEDNDIRVSVFGNTVTLEGTVNSLYAKEEAGHIAWKAPGIWEVKNKLTVDYKYAF
ncbi:BON domain-containing protein [Chryseobacterium carnipullorum]|uniref:BON domain-containing protein n=1 Tax=Chryseobacterium carnipullorum TaxID=1124835 RepID=A0A376DZ56_CHRCU|nr:BON domain-containing protein [Chryseobacterium carnipullorum]AZA50324.1 BON domain-containing protein [Chryseobacterium carnipullorum]AZA65197.1 BON domain-containing protein [Chryseobacterium carnipullorum]STC98465.1 Osmotically-inducible protein Y precursor [Chryseobacterium carnipullorum]